jgi:hypothetical protein
VLGVPHTQWVQGPAWLMRSSLLCVGGISAKHFVLCTHAVCAGSARLVCRLLQMLQQPSRQASTQSDWQQVGWLNKRDPHEKQCHAGLRTCCTKCSGHIYKRNVQAVCLLKSCLSAGHFRRGQYSDRQLERRLDYRCKSLSCRREVEGKRRAKAPWVDVEEQT